MRRCRRAAVALALAVVTTLGGWWGLASPASAAVNDSDATWLITAHRTNLAEIAAGRSAQLNGSTKKIRQLGDMLISEHTKLDVQVVALAQQNRIALPSEPGPAQTDRLRAAESQRGAAYDSDWVAGQIAGHRSMITATDNELTGGQDEAVLDLAQKSAPVLVRHLNRLQDVAGTPERVIAGDGGQAVATVSAVPAWFAGAGVVLLLAAGAVTVAGRGRSTTA
jgi:putative membrane protein